MCLKAPCSNAGRFCFIHYFRSHLKKHIPNFITCLNLLCGCVALVEIFRGHLALAAYLIFIAAILDLLDGLSARWLNAYSELGKQMDSLADVISFGLVPGAVMFWMLQQSHLETVIADYNIRMFVQFLPFIITIFSALRLGKFNIDTRQTTSFIGLPTPANTLFIVSLPLIVNENNSSWNAVLLNPYFIVGSCILLSYLLVAKLPMFSLKMKNLSSFGVNRIQYIFLALSVVLFAIFFIKAIPLIIILYIFLSLLNYLFKKQAADSQINIR